MTVKAQAAAVRPVSKVAPRADATRREPPTPLADTSNDAFARANAHGYGQEPPPTPTRHGLGFSLVPVLPPEPPPSPGGSTDRERDEGEVPRTPFSFANVPLHADGAAPFGPSPARLLRPDAPRRSLSTPNVVLPPGGPTSSVVGRRVLGPLVAPGHPLQMKLGLEGASFRVRSGVHALAASGFRGQSGTLPHLDVIQPAFGRHDVSRVKAHVDGRSAGASRALGAIAYASGEEVAFARAPSLYVAAHEAAHVVQQRAGIQLQGGVGAASDPFERHADQVAEEVAQGRSAEPLLDRFSPVAPSAARVDQPVPVQRMKDDDKVFPGSPGGGIVTFTDQVAFKTKWSETIDGAKVPVEFTDRFDLTIEYRPALDMGDPQLRFTLTYKGSSAHFLADVGPPMSAEDGKVFVHGLDSIAPPRADVAVPGRKEKDLQDVAHFVEVKDEGFEIALEANTNPGLPEEQRHRIRFFHDFKNSEIVVDPDNKRGHRELSFRIEKTPSLGESGESIRIGILDPAVRRRIDELNAPAARRPGGAPEAPRPRKFEIVGFDDDGNPITVGTREGPPALPAPRATAAKAAVSIGGIWSNDITLGGYDDRFRITTQSFGATEGLFGLAGVVGTTATGGAGARLHFDEPLDPRVLTTSGNTITLSLHGGGAADCTIVDRIDVPRADISKASGGTGKSGDPRVDRDHRIKITCAELAGGEVEWVYHVEQRTNLGYLGQDESSRLASSNAAAVTDLQRQQTLGADPYEEANRYEGQLAQKRHRAAYVLKLIPTDLADTSEVLSTALHGLVVQQRSDATKLGPEMLRFASDNAKALYRTLDRETRNSPQVAYQESSAQMGERTENPFTREKYYATDDARDLATQIADALEQKQITVAYGYYRQLTRGLDAWIQIQLNKEGGAQWFEAKEFAYLDKATRVLEEVRGKPGVKRLAAVFYPDAQYRDSEGGKVPLPLSLYLWKEGDEWKLRDLTNPDDIFTDSFAIDREHPDVVPDGLFQELDAARHFPKGRIHWQIPGGAGGQLATTERRTWKDYLAYAATALGALGLVASLVVTAGATAPAVVVAADVILVLGAAAGAASAVLDVAEMVEHGNIKAGDLVLDLAQVVVSVASLGTLAAGKFVGTAVKAQQAYVEYKAAIAAGEAWTKPIPQMLAAESRAAGLAQAARKIYIPLRAINAGADAVMVLVVTEDTFKNIEALKNANMSPEEHQRALFLLFGQLLMNAGMSLISAVHAGAELMGGVPDLKVSVVEGRKVIEIVKPAASAEGSRGAPPPTPPKGQETTPRAADAVNPPRTTEGAPATPRVESTVPPGGETLVDERVEPAASPKASVLTEEETKALEKARREIAAAHAELDFYLRGLRLVEYSPNEEDRAKVPEMRRLQGAVEKKLATAVDKNRQVLEDIVKRRRHPSLTAMDRARDLYKVRIDGKEYFGTLEALMDFVGPPEGAAKLGDTLFTQEAEIAGAKVEVAGGVAGPTAENRTVAVQEGVALTEAIKITAGTKENAAEAIALSIQRTVSRAESSFPGEMPIVFEGMTAGYYPSDHPAVADGGRRVVRWTAEDVKRGYLEYTPKGSDVRKRYSLAQALAAPGERAVRTFWKGPIDARGTYGEITKELHYEAVDPQGRGLFKTADTGQGFQEVSIGKPRPIAPDVARGKLVSALEPQIGEYARAGDWLNAVKRAYAVARTENDLLAMAALEPLLSGKKAELHALARQVELFVNDVVQPEQVGAGAAAKAQEFPGAADPAVKEARGLVARLKATDDPAVKALGDTFEALVNAAGEKVAGNEKLYMAASEDVVDPFVVMEASDAGYAGQARKVLVERGYLSASEQRPSQRQDLERIAEALNKKRSAIEEQLRQDPAAGNAQRNRVLGELRDVQGGTPPVYEGFVLDSILSENIEAVKKARSVLETMKPDAILGMERGGEFLAQVVAYGDPELAKLTVTIPKTAPKGKFKFDAAAIIAQIEGLITAGKKRFVLVDAYMGGRTAGELRDGIFKPLATAHADVTFDTVWLRETFGFEVLDEQGGLVLRAPRGAVPEGSPIASRIKQRTIPVRVVLGDDMNLVLDKTAGSREPIRIFNARGEIVRTITPHPGETTRDALIRAMNGQP